MPEFTKPAVEKHEAMAWVKVYLNMQFGLWSS